MSQAYAVSDRRACLVIRAHAADSACGCRDNDQRETNAAKLFASKAGDAFKKFKTV